MGVIISNIIGGLGNQMFQYAAGRALSLQKGVALRLELSDFRGYELHNGYELSRIFKVPNEATTDADLRELIGWRRYRLARKALRRSQFSGFRNGAFIVEKDPSSWDVREIPPRCYLDGYWQSERYFKEVAGTIREDFSFALPMTADNARVAGLIRSCTAVSVHVRRGDYVSNAKTKAVHGTCSLDYYRFATDLLIARLKDPVFFVFSDDAHWVRDHLQIKAQCVLVDHNRGPESYNDMRLMSICRHNIIANSSFSWWGAWLNENPEKKVIAPAKWFAAPRDASYLYPSEWILM
jgi:hypothetical protein